MRILRPIEHIDCPGCVGVRLALVTYHATARVGNCRSCKGESVVRKDEGKILRTARNYSERKGLGIK